MAIKTFTTSEVLTAADTNTYLANSGLVFVKSQTIGSAVANVTVSSAFSATYDSYLINIDGGTASTDIVFGLKFGSATTNYYSGITGVQWTGTASTNARNNTEANLLYVGTGNADALQMSYTVQNPFLTKRTFGSGAFIPYNAMYFQAGILATTTSYTDFTINFIGGTATGGTITVYGYRKA
jgi:hypothetical protein